MQAGEGAWLADPATQGKWDKTKQYVKGNFVQKDTVKASCSLLLPNQQARDWRSC